MKRNIGSIILIIGIILIMLSTVHLINLRKPVQKTPSLWDIMTDYKEMHSYDESTKTWVATRRHNTYALLGLGIVLSTIGILVSAKQKPDKKRILAVPLEYFGRTMIGFTIARITASVLLIWALGEHPYDYYTLLRFVVCGVTAYGIYLAVRFKQITWAWIFGIVTVLFNPIFPIHLERGTWAIIDVSVAVLSMASIFLFRGQNRES